MREWLSELGWRIETCRWNIRLKLEDIRKALVRGTFLFFYWVGLTALLTAGVFLSIYLLTITWNVGPVRLLGLSSMAYIDSLAVFAFVWTAWQSYKAFCWVKRKLNQQR